MTCVMNPDVAWSGPSPVWSTHGARSPWAASDSNVSPSQSRQRRQHASHVLEQPAPPEAAQRLTPEPEPGRRPELGSEHAEGEVGVGHEAVEHGLPGRAVRGGVPGELRDVVLERRRQERSGPVGIRGAGRKLRVEVFDAASIQVGLQLGVRGRAGEEGVPRGEHLVCEAGDGEVGGRPNTAAELLAPLEDAHVPASLREQRRPGECVDPGADEDRVESRHGADANQCGPRLTCHSVV